MILEEPLTEDEINAVVAGRISTADYLWSKDVDSDAVYYLLRAFCDLVGHQPERDHCGMPEHDYCYWCGLGMPNSWGKVD